jgi:GGDEF domain-containing protein
MLDVLLALARRDVESGALNPEGLDAALAQRVGRAWPFALLVGELDPASDDGDELVREAVRVLTSQLGPVAEVARTGPTRVVVLAPATSQRIARETAGEAERALRADGPDATFGWAFYPAEGADAISLLQTASERLYARRIVRGEWAPTAASAGLVDELPAPRVAAGS